MRAPSRACGRRPARAGSWPRRRAGSQAAGAKRRVAGCGDHATTCNITRPTSVVDLVLTGSRTSCRSRWGAFDMIGNAEEWVADWVTLAGECNATWLAGDLSCVGAPAQPGAPAALVRGGSFLDGQGAGVFNVRSDFDPSFADVGIGFRCAR